MDHDQQKFYRDEDAEQEAVAQFQAEGEDQGIVADVDNDYNDAKYFLKLLSALRTAIVTGKNVPLTNKKVIDADTSMKIINDLEKNLPDAVQYGMQMFSEKERILGNAETVAMNRVTSAEMRAKAALEKAKHEAEQILSDAENEARAILADAQERADHMVCESEIVRQAREEARIIKNDARVEASELRLKATHDAYQLMVSVEDELNEALNAVRQRRAELGEEAE